MWEINLEDELSSWFSFFFFFFRNFVNGRSRGKQILKKEKREYSFRENFCLFFFSTDILRNLSGYIRGTRLMQNFCASNFDEVEQNVEIRPNEKKRKKKCLKRQRLYLLLIGKKIKNNNVKRIGVLFSSCCYFPILWMDHSCWHNGQRLFCFTHKDMQQ